jgi:hypothetical protein
LATGSGDFLKDAMELLFASLTNALAGETSDPTREYSEPSRIVTCSAIAHNIVRDQLVVAPPRPHRPAAEFLPENQERLLA